MSGELTAVLKGKRIGVLMGGSSTEREISLKTGEAVLASIKRQGYTAVGIDVDKAVGETLRKEKIDLAFIALHGLKGEDGAIQGLLEILNIPYTGSGILASALGMDKIASRKVFVFHKLPVPEFVILRHGEDSSRIFSAFDLPVVVKPSCQGSSVGVSIVRDKAELGGAMNLAFKYGPEISREVNAYLSRQAFKRDLSKEPRLCLCGSSGVGMQGLQPRGYDCGWKGRPLPFGDQHPSRYDRDQLIARNCPGGGY
jgi:D-alanine--D-alanine ligase